MVLVSSRCKVISVLDLKDAFPSMRLSEIQKDIAEYYHTLVCFIFTSKNVNAYGIKYLTINLAIMYKCNCRMFTKQKILQSKNG